MFAWQATVQDEFGNAVLLPVITVYESDGVTLADIFEEDEVTPLDNPLTGTMEGFVQFWAEAGQYKIVGADGPSETAEWSVFLGTPITGAASTIATSDLTASRALVSNGSGKVAVSAVTSTQLGYLSGVTSAIQTQLDSKAPTITKATTGEAEAGTGTGIMDATLTAAAIAAQVATLSGRNLIINGSGRINQRSYTSGTATVGANQFTLDRWFVITSGQNLTFTGTEAGRVMTAPAGGVAQVIEGANIVGGTYVINWTGTATCTVDGTARAKGESFTLTANTNTTVKFAGGTYSEIQLELGTIPTAFESINFQQDTTNCEWYYYPIKLRCRFRANGASEVGANGYTFPRMRAAPTAVFLSNDATVNVASVSISSISSSSLTFELITTAAGDTYRIDDYGLSAELTA